MTPGQVKSHQLALELIGAGLRLSIVHGLTDVSTRTLRRWWRDIHGVRPPNGKLPESVLSLIRSADSAATASAYAAFHTRLYGTSLSPDGLLVAWREFGRLCAPIDINAAYYAIRDIKAKIVRLARCETCNAAFIYDTGSRWTRHCPFCKGVNGC